MQNFKTYANLINDEELTANSNNYAGVNFGFLVSINCFSGC